MFSKNFIDISWSTNQIFFTENCFWKDSSNIRLKTDFENQYFEIFDKVIHNFGKPDEVII